MTLPPTRPRRSPLIPAIVAVLALIMAAAVYRMSWQRDTTGDGGTKSGVVVVDPPGLATGSRSLTPEQAASRSLAGSLSTQLARRTADDPLARGRVDAPVLMIVFSEFQCPFCGKYARDIHPQLNRYVADGTLRMEWRDFPYLGKESTAVAVAARAAARQGRFWAFHDAWFAAQPPPNSGRATPTYLEQIAAAAGADPARFRRDLADPELATAVTADVDAAHRVGIGGTPAFLINGSVIMGAQPLEDFVRAIEFEADQARAR